MATMGKRGDGYIYKRGGIWWLCYSIRGRKIRESSKSSNEAEARRQLRVHIGEAASGVDVAPRKATIDDLFQLVKADYELRGLRSIYNVQWRYGAHIKDALGKLLASRFSHNTATEYIRKRRAEGAADASINLELSILRRGFALAMRQMPPLVRMVPYIPALALDNARQGFIEEADYLRLRMALPMHLKALFVIAYHTGMRLGELRKLRWDQVDLAAGEIRIERKQAKAKKPRTIPIYGDMAEWLEAQPHDGDLVFTWRGKPIGPHVRGWKKACVDAGLPDLHVHDLRRSAVRNMERAGVPRHISMAILGHSTEAMFRRYDIVTPKDMRDAADKLDRYRNRTPEQAQNRHTVLKIVNNK